MIYHHPIHQYTSVSSVSSVSFRSSNHHSYHISFQNLPTFQCLILVSLRLGPSHHLGGPAWRLEMDSLWWPWQRIKGKPSVDHFDGDTTAINSHQQPSTAVERESWTLNYGEVVLHHTWIFSCTKPMLSHTALVLSTGVNLSSWPPYTCPNICSPLLVVPCPSISHSF